ncbi:MAG: hypothetical protein OXE43_13985 [Chloroflexi bacterium]|nr:hypothetical protein [Chloroflexota bacterium]
MELDDAEAQQGLAVHVAEETPTTAGIQADRELLGDDGPEQQLG